MKYKPKRERYTVHEDQLRQSFVAIEKGNIEIPFNIMISSGCYRHMPINVQRKYEGGDRNG